MALMPLNGANTDMTMQANYISEAVASDFGPPPGQGLRYVLKEERFIGGSSYFVEMATDGQTLAVSAFDRDMQDTLELLVNEANHQQLLYESGGDYGHIAQRLRVKDGRLVIISLEALSEGYEIQDEVETPQGAPQ